MLFVACSYVGLAYNTACFFYCCPGAPQPLPDVPVDVGCNVICGGGVGVEVEEKIRLLPRSDSCILD